MADVESLIAASNRQLFIGIGGGGDIVGALAVAETLSPNPGEALLGGLTWERPPIDPILRPRRLDELSDLERLNDSVAWATATTRGPEGTPLAESQMAAFMRRPTLLIDPSGGAEVLARDIADAAARLDCDLVVLVDVGGDVLASGHEPSLVSPLCDAVCLAAGVQLSRETKVLGAIVGAGCDGELTLDELSERLALVAAADGLLAVRGISGEAVVALSDALNHVQTEASRLMLECARGGCGRRRIRGGARTAWLSPYGAVIFLFDPTVAFHAAAPLAKAAASGDFFDARLAMNALGVDTELDQSPTPARHLREHSGTSSDQASHPSPEPGMNGRRAHAIQDPRWYRVV